MVDELVSKAKRRSDYWKLRPRLDAGDAKAWEKAINDFFVSRVESRYLIPIEALQLHGRYEGEGFAISAIHCSLIEFLESSWQGKNYKYKSPTPPYEYSSSRGIFVDFLTKREPFSRFFDLSLAEDFYSGVRCGLLHEARTKNGWRIRAVHRRARVIDAGRKILYRNNFHEAMLAHIENYRCALQADKELQDAFLRKFDKICS